LNFGLSPDFSGFRWANRWAKGLLKS